MFIMLGSYKQIRQNLKMNDLWAIRAKVMIFNIY